MSESRYKLQISQVVGPDAFTRNQQVTSTASISRPISLMQRPCVSYKSRYCILKQKTQKTPKKPK